MSDSEVVLRWDVDEIVERAVDPDLYAVATFMEPMRLSAMRFNAQLKRAKCSKCAKKRLRQTFEKVAQAFLSLANASLSQDESNKQKLAEYVKLKTGTEPEVLELAVRYDPKAPAWKLQLR